MRPFIEIRREKGDYRRETIPVWKFSGNLFQVCSPEKHVHFL